MTVLALIPARGGSKGIPRKNLQIVGGRSLIERAVEAVCKSGVADHIIVSTDDTEIAQAAMDAGAEVPFMRPADLAMDTSATIPVIRHAIDTFEMLTGKRVRTLVFTEPTSPFRTGEHIRLAMKQYLSGLFKSVISVCPLERKPQNIFMKVENGQLCRYIREPNDQFSRRQEMDHLCRLSGDVYIVGRDDFMSFERLVIEPVGFIETSSTDAINIDEEIDLLLAQSVAKHYGL